jgi:L-alanine-DL-glutamate epimerase-like enolase superfamily enzyme
MTLEAKFEKKLLTFNFDAGTSRGVLKEKPTWILNVYDKNNPSVKGTGECSPIWGLSPEKENEYEAKLEEVCKEINHFELLLKIELLPYPSIYFGLETALMDLFKGGRKIIFDTPFTDGKAGIKINGLVWMSTIDEMYASAIQKHKEGFNCIKLKIGAQNLSNEIELLKTLRKELGNEVQLRCDANGAFDFSTAKEVLSELKSLNIHSIEQPLKQGMIEETQKLCALNLIPVALDEEMIGIYKTDEKEKLIGTIQPQYIILKPSLHGGFLGIREWISIAEKNNADWWITSALESNVGLNAIAQYTYQTKKGGYHGLGTGKIYANNFNSPLTIKGEELFHLPENQWDEI